VAVCVLGVLNTARAFLRPDPAQIQEAREEARATHWPTVGLLAAVLVLYGVLLDPLGYWPATAALVVAVARILGSRSVVRDIVVGMVLSGSAYLAFTQLLGISLPAGLLSGIM
jgi:putative tricarboxylic transport membrane protein